MDKTASILIIGNEILSGKTPDINSIYLSKELRGLGVNVRKILVIPDNEEDIAEETNKDSKRFTWVFSCGGIGPTHDDVTLEGIALGLSRKLFAHPDLLKILQEKRGQDLNDACRKLAMVPEGTRLLYAETLKFPVLMVENIIIFPGVPEIMQKKFISIKNQFQTIPFALKKIYLTAYEEDIAHYLDAVLEKFPKLLLGSYPILNEENFSVLLTLESKDPLFLDASFQYLLNLIPQNIIFKTEK